MKYFETRYGAGIGQEIVKILPEQEALWAAAFGVEDFEYVFDQATADSALPLFDAAINRLNHEPDTLRPLVPAGFRGGLIRTRRVLEQMRSTLADFPDASISGPMEE